MQQFCSRREDVENIERFWQDPVWELITYLTEPRPWAIKIVAIAHNFKVIDLHFILTRAIVLKWNPKIIMYGL